MKPSSLPNARSSTPSFCTSFICNYIVNPSERDTGPNEHMVWYNIQRKMGFQELSLNGGVFRQGKCVVI